MAGNWRNHHNSVDFGIRTNCFGGEATEVLQRDGGKGVTCFDGGGLEVIDRKSCKLQMLVNYGDEEDLWFD